MLKVTTYAKGLLSLTFIATAVDCEDVSTASSPGPEIPRPVKGYDGRRLIWEPKPGGWQLYEPCFSPDGRKIVASYRPGKDAPIGDLALLDLNTGELEVILKGGRYVRPDWSPDGGWIAYQNDESGFRGIWLVRPDGSGNHRLDISDWSYKPAWGPNSERIYFPMENPKAKRLDAAYYVLNGGKVVTLHHAENFDHRAVLPGPGGGEVALNLFNDEYHSSEVILAFVGADGGDLRIVWYGAFSELGWPVDWSPGGNYVLVCYYGFYSNQQTLWTYETKTHKVRQLTMCPPGKDVDPITEGSWGPSGNIVFATEEGKLYLIKGPE
jgi:dipeptidyl aminopeptidase/acylaminoacyl peptidase